ncbi:MAG: mechanosensitive ion channel domain-containing protein [Synechococcaceae cyanobacterium]|nr:mechanosensitive ion channel domain-containing protein [Synechococcaceae cyanobacterium]
MLALPLRLRLSPRLGLRGLLLAALLAAVLLGSSPAAPAGSAWVNLEGRRVLEIRSAAGAQTPDQLAQRASAGLRQLADDSRISPEQLVVREDPPYSMVGVASADGRFSARLAVDDRAGRAFNLSRQELAERYRDQLRGAIRQYRSSHSLRSWLRGTALALLVLALGLLWMRWQWGLNARLGRWIHRSPHPWLQGLRLGGNELLDTIQVRQSLQFVRRCLHWLVLVLAGYLLIPLLLGFFPPTQAMAEGLRGQLLTVVSRLLEGVVAAIPNLFSIAVILGLTGLVIRASNAWFRALEGGRVRLPGFYPEWSRPTGRLVAGAILLAGLVIAFPYVPGSGSKVFQGAGLFVGVLAALGSSAIATNIISGLMLIYTRGFREGDRVEINGVLGVVQDRALLVTRIQTPRNELVSIPNATVIGASVVNFSFSRREIDQPVAVATTITIGYDVPWRQVHALLLAAAAAVEGIAAEPSPFVLQTSLNDFHISYELNAFVADVARYRETLSALLGAIQDQFAGAAVEILSPGYQAIRNGNRSTVPPFTGSEPPAGS